MHGYGKYTVYVLRSDAYPRRHYVGTTTDLLEHLAWHNAGSCRHTVSNRPWSVVVSMEFAREAVARRFAKYLKSGSGRAFAKRHFADT
jgi:putative endonuclease